MLRKLRAFTCIGFGLMALLFAGFGLLDDNVSLGSVMGTTAFGLIAIYWGRWLLTSKKEHVIEKMHREYYSLEWFLIKNYSFHTLLLIAASAIPFYFINVGHHLTLIDLPRELALKSGADYGPYVAHGQIWRMFTGNFIHNNLAHLIGNMWPLFVVGRYIDYYFGTRRYYLIYIVTGISSSLASHVIHPNLLSLGASGAIFGLYGALLMTFIMKHPNKKIMKFSKWSMFWIAVSVARSLSSGFNVPGVDNAAHVGGFLSGIAMGYFILEYRYPVFMLRNGAAAALAMVFIGMEATVYKHVQPMKVLEAREVAIGDWNKLAKATDRFGAWLNKMGADIDSVKKRKMTEVQFLEKWKKQTKPDLVAMRKTIHEMKIRDENAYQAQLSLYRSVAGYESFLQDVYEGSQDTVQRAVASNQGANALESLKQTMDQIQSAYRNGI